MIQTSAQIVPCPERLDAIMLLTDKFTDISVNHEEVIHHSVVSGAVHEANWANSLSSVIFRMFQQMSSVRICFGRESLEAHATSDFKYCYAQIRVAVVVVVVVNDIVVTFRMVEYIVKMIDNFVQISVARATTNNVVVLVNAIVFLVVFKLIEDEEIVLFHEFAGMVLEKDAIGGVVIVCVAFVGVAQSHVAVHIVGDFVGLVISCN